MWLNSKQKTARRALECHGEKVDCNFEPQPNEKRNYKHIANKQRKTKTGKENKETRKRCCEKIKRQRTAAVLSA